MAKFHWLQGSITAFLITGLFGAVHAQDTGFKGFLHRAGAAVSQTASNVLGNHQGAPNGQAAGPATTTGAYYRPISPASPGNIVGIFDNHPQRAPWPRVAVHFTQFGANLSCWKATATIWRSSSRHSEETFQICNAPLAFVDAMGQRHFMTAPEDSAASGSRGALQLDIAQNTQGISHVETAPGDVRNEGPLPPHMLFNLGDATQSGPFAHQYHEILIRLLWLTGWMNHANPVLDTNAGKTLWVVGFDSAGKAN